MSPCLCAQMYNGAFNGVCVICHWLPLTVTTDRQHLVMLNPQPAGQHFSSVLLLFSSSPVKISGGDALARGCWITSLQCRSHHRLWKRFDKQWLPAGNSWNNGLLKFDTGQVKLGTLWPIPILHWRLQCRRVLWSFVLSHSASLSVKSVTIHRLTQHPSLIFPLPALSCGSQLALPWQRTAPVLVSCVFSVLNSSLCPLSALLPSQNIHPRGAKERVPHLQSQTFCREA